MAKADRMNIICTGVHVVISRPLQAGVAKPGRNHAIYPGSDGILIIVVGAITVLQDERES